MSFAVYSALVHDASSRAPPLFTASSSASGVEAERTLFTTHTLYQHERRPYSPGLPAKLEDGEMRIRQLRVMIPTPNASTNALDVPHLLPAVLQRQRQSLLQHHAHMVLPHVTSTTTPGLRAPTGGSALPCRGGVEDVPPVPSRGMSAAHRKDLVAQAYQRALSSTSSTTMAMMAFGAPRHPSSLSPRAGRRAVDGPPSASPAKGATQAFASSVAGVSAAATPYLPSGAAPVQRRRVVASASRSGDTSPSSSSVAGLASLRRAPLWSRSPTPSEAMEAARHVLAAEVHEEGEGERTVAAQRRELSRNGDNAPNWESPPRADPSGVVTRSPSSLRFSTSPSRAWSPPSTAFVRHRAGYAAPLAAVDSPSVAGVALPAATTVSARMHVDTTQPFISFVHASTGAAITQPPSPTTVTVVSKVGWGTHESSSVSHPQDVVALSFHEESDGEEEKNDNDEARVVDTTLFAADTTSCVTPRDRVVLHPGLSCAADMVDVRVDKPSETDEDAEPVMWRTPSSSAQRPRPSVQLLLSAAGLRHRARDRPTPVAVAQDGTERAAQTRASPRLPQRLALPSELTGAHSHVVRSASVHSVSQTPMRCDGDAAAELRMRVLAKQRALETMLAEAEEGTESPPHRTGMPSTTATVDTTWQASWALRSLDSASVSVHDVLEAAPWRPTVNSLPTVTAAGQPDPRQLVRRAHVVVGEDTTVTTGAVSALLDQACFVESQSSACRLHARAASAQGSSQSPSPLEGGHRVEHGQDAAEPEDEAGEVVGMDESGRLLYRRPARGGSVGFSTPFTDTVSAPAFCSMESVFAEHGFGMPYTTDGRRPVGAPSVAASPRNGAHEIPKPPPPHAEAHHEATAELRRHQAHRQKAPPPSWTTGDDDEEDSFAVRRSTVHDVLTYLLTADGDGARRRAPLGGAPLSYYQLPASLRDVPLSVEASPSGERRSDTSLFLHVRPSTGAASTESVVPPSHPSSREGSASFLQRPTTLLPHDLHTARSSGREDSEHESIGLSAIECPSSVSRASLLSGASFEHLATRLGSGRPSGSASARPSWAPRKAAPRASHTSSQRTSSRPSDASAFAVEALRFSSSGSAIEGTGGLGVASGADSARTEAFAAAANELAESLRAYGERQRRDRQRTDLETLAAPQSQSPPHHAPQPTVAVLPGATARALSLSLHSEGTTASATAALASAAREAQSSRSPSLRSPSWTTRQGQPTPAGAAATAASLSPVAGARGTRSESCAQSPPVVSFRLPDDEASGRRGEVVNGGVEGVTPWVLRLLRVQQQLQALQRGVAARVDGEEDGVHALDDARHSEDSEAFAHASPAHRPSPDAILGDGGAHAGILAASWWSGSGRDGSSHSVPLSSGFASRAQSRSSVSGSSVMAGRRAILLDGSLPSASLERELLSSWSTAASGAVPPSEAHSRVVGGVSEQRAQSSESSHLPTRGDLSTSSRHERSPDGTGECARFARHGVDVLKENEVPEPTCVAVVVAGEKTPPPARLSARSSALQDGRTSLNPQV